MARTVKKSLIVRFAGDNKELARTVGRVEASFKRVGRSAKSVAGGAVKAFGTLTAAVGVLGYAMNRLFVQPYGQQQEAVESLRTALIATGKDGTKALSSLTAEASRLQAATTFGDEAILKASASLATLAPSLDAAGLERAQTALVALADTFFKGDLESAATALGKTLGSTTNALARYGIQITNSAAPASEKLAEIMGSATMGAAFEVAKTKAETVTGRILQLKNAIGDLQEKIGEILVEVLNVSDNAGGLTTKVQDLTKSIDENRTKWINWGKVVLQGLHLTWEIGLGLVKVFWNVLQILGRVAAAVALLLTGQFAKVHQQVSGIRGDLEDMGDVGDDVADAMTKFDSAIFDLYQNIEIARPEIKSISMAVGGLIQVSKDAAAAIAGRGSEEAPSLADSLHKAADAALDLGAVTPRLNATMDSLQEQVTRTDRAVSDVSQNLSTSMVEALRRGGSAWIAFGKQVLAMIGRMISQWLVFKVLTSALGPLHPIVGLFGGATGLGQRAAGGSVFSGKAYVVGERGTELLVPNSAGRVIPNSQVSSMTAPAPAVSFVLDLSSLPPAQDPFSVSRDANWLRILGDSLRNWEANGGRLVKQSGG